MKNNKFEIIYSVVIIVTIPALLIANTVLLANNARADYVTEIRRKADTVNQAFAITAKQYITDSNTEKLQQYIDSFVTEAPAIKGLYVANISTSPYEVIAGSNAGKQLETYQLQHISFAKDTNKPIARKGESIDSDGNKTTVWEVATPIKDNNGQPIAVAVSSVTTADADELINNTYAKSYIFLAVSVAVVIALLIHHFKIAGYSRLLAKQKEINQTMSDFLSVATHELKAPTAIIKGYIANVLDGMFGSVTDSVKEQLNVAIGQTDRLNNLVQDLLNVSRVEQGRVQYDITQVNVSAVIQVIVDNYQAAAHQKGLTIVYQPLEDAIVAADAGRVQEIFTNLIDNAVKYTPTGSVTVQHAKQKQFLVTTVRDTGMGISADDRKRLFQRFYRIKNEQTKDISGTGLGLWIIKQYIEAMGGKIEVDSLVGSGTQFSVYLPLIKGTNT